MNVKVADLMVLTSFDLLKLVEQHRFIVKAGPTPSRRAPQRQ